MISNQQVTNIFCHGHGAITYMSAKEVKIPSNCEVIFYNASGTAMADNYAEKVFGEFKYIGTEEARKTKWDTKFKGKIYYKIRENKRHLPEEPNAEVLPIIEKDFTINTVLTGSRSLTHSGIYKEEVKIKGLEKGQELTLQEIITEITNKEELKGQMLRVHWLACLSDHIAGDLDEIKLKGCGYKACITEK